MVAIPQRTRLDTLIVSAGLVALMTVFLPHAVTGWSRGEGLLGSILLFACALLYLFDRAFVGPGTRRAPSGAVIASSVTGTSLIAVRAATLPGGPYARIVVALIAGLIQLLSIAAILGTSRTSTEVRSKSTPRRGFGRLARRP